VPFDYTINPYRGCTHACRYCFARPTHTYLNMNAGRDFETKIVVKVNAPEVLRRELAAKRWKGDHIAMGTNTATLGLATYPTCRQDLPSKSGPGSG
jgi:DNA repair photolyase